MRTVLQNSTVASVVFDIETVGIEWDRLDDAQKTYLSKNARTDEERLKLPESLSLWPLTGRIVVLAMLNPDTGRGRVWYEKTDGRLEENSSDGLFTFVGDAEPVFLAEFWKAIARFHRFVGRLDRQIHGNFTRLRFFNSKGLYKSPTSATRAGILRSVKSFR